PGLAAVARDVDEAVVGARPEEARLERGFGEGEDRRVVLGADVVPGDRAAGGLERLRIVVGEVGADRLPAHAAVGRAEEVVAGGVEGVRPMARGDDREGPLEAVLEVSGGPAGVVVGPDGDVLDLAGPPVVAGHGAAVAAAVDDVRVVVAHGDVAAL